MESELIQIDVVSQSQKTAVYLEFFPLLNDPPIVEDDQVSGDDFLTRNNLQGTHPGMG